MIHPNGNLRNIIYFNLLTNVGDRQTQLMKDLGKRQVPGNICPSKEIVQEIQSRSSYPNLDVETYNNGHQEGCNRKVVYMESNLSFQ